MLYYPGQSETAYLEKPAAHAKIHLANFSSAFNLEPHNLANKHTDDLNLGNQLVAWIVDYCHVTVCVFVNGKYSDMRLTYMGSPQGHQLYILYMDSCVQMHMQTVTKCVGDHTLALQNFAEW